MMRRLQSNLSYLAQRVERNKNPHQPQQPGPAIMHAPQSHPGLVDLYTKLQGLYPGWKGQPGQMKASPGSQQRLGSLPQTPVNTGLPTPMSSAGQPMMPQGNNVSLQPEPQQQQQQQQPTPQPQQTMH
jgi:hypothetical protein